MHSSELYETTHHDGNLDLLQYFEEKPVDMDHERAQDAFMAWIETAIGEENQQKLMRFLQVDSFDDIGPFHYYELTSSAKRQFADWLEWTNETAFFLHDDPLSSPAWMLMEPITGKLLPKNTPLIHFSDHAEQIKQHGFQFGVPDVDRIALTREHNPYAPDSQGQRISYGKPGYNFAYMANVDLDMRAGGYGSSAILFRSTGMLVHHQGDREQQVVFWGPAANTRSGIVMSRKNNRWVTDGGNSDMSLNRLVRRILAPKSSIKPSKPIAKQTVKPDKAHQDYVSVQ